MLTTLRPAGGRATTATGMIFCKTAPGINLARSQYDLRSTGYARRLPSASGYLHRRWIEPYAPGTARIGLSSWTAREIGDRALFFSRYLTASIHLESHRAMVSCIHVSEDD